MIFFLGFLAGWELLPVVGVVLVLALAVGAYDSGKSLFEVIPWWLPITLSAAIAVLPYKISRWLKQKRSKSLTVINWSTILAASILFITYGGSLAMHWAWVFILIYMPVAILLALGWSVIFLLSIIVVPTMILDGISSTIKLKKRKRGR